MGAVFPLFTTQMYEALGVNWASAVPAFASLACLPFPFLFYKYGASIRKKCKFAAEAEAMLERMMAAQQGAKRPNNGDEDDEKVKRQTSVETDETASVAEHAQAKSKDARADSEMAQRGDEQV